MTSRAIAIETADRNVVAGCRGDSDVGKGTGYSRAVAAEALNDTLVHSSDRVGRILTRGRMALGTRRVGRNVVCGPQGGRRGKRAGVVTLAAAPRRGMTLIEGCRRSRVAGGRRRARGHPHKGSRFVAGLTRQRGDGGVVHRRAGECREVRR